MRKMVLLLLGFFVACTVSMIVLAQFNNQAFDLKVHAAEGFYYAALGFGIYYIFNRRKEMQDAAASMETVEPEASPLQASASNNDATADD